MYNNYSVETDNIIALCHILEEFDNFEKRLLAVISPKYNRDFANQVCSISESKFKLGAGKARIFYNENKTVIDTINKYSNITRFINDGYSCRGKSKGSFQFFYKYLLKHKKDLNKILEILYKLKELGFNSFEFNENLDFTIGFFYAYPLFAGNHFIYYVANIEVMPNCVDHINYKTTASNYKMQLSVNGNEISEHGRKITLNSLLFDPISLPTKIDRKNTFEHILKLKQVSVLDSQLNAISQTINKLKGMQNKQQFNDILSSIKEDVEKLKVLSLQINANAKEHNQLLTPEILEPETKCLKR